MEDDDKKAERLEIHWRQWAIEQSVASGANPEDVEYFANKFLCYVLGTTDRPSNTHIVDLVYPQRTETQPC